MIFTYLRMRLITAAFCMYLLNQECRGQEHLGCYADNRTERLLPTLAKVSNSNTVDICIDTCKNIGETYAGVEYGEECWCGDSHGFSRNDVAVAPDMMNRWCNFGCKGNKSQLCGGIDYINVYSVCPRGRYHDPEEGVGNCDSECYCNASHICLYSTGQCPGGCQGGWYGASCSLTNPQTTPHSRSMPMEEITLTDTNGHRTMDNTDTNPSTTDPDKTGETATTGIAVGVAIAVLLIFVATVVVLVCCYRRRQRELPDNGKESRDAVPLPDVLYAEVDMEAKAESRGKRQEEDGNGKDKEGDTVVNNDLYGSVSSNNYHLEKDDTFGYVNNASKPPGWKKKKVEAAPAESYTMDDARCESDGKQKQPVQSDMVAVVDNALYGSPDEEDGGRVGFHGDQGGTFSKSTKSVEPLYDSPKRRSIAL